MELIRLEEITKTYQMGQVMLPVLNGISLSIERGEFVALMGASGSGKTTLMNLLGCLDRPTSGKYWFEGEELSQVSADARARIRNSKIGFVFQNFNLLPRTDAVQNVLLPLEYSADNSSAAAKRKTATAILERVGLANRLDHEPSQMSGGQQQRVAIARALVNRPALVLADEPTGNLDSHTSREILDMFEKLNAEGITVVLVTHDPEVAARARRVIHITDGLIDKEDAAIPATGAPQQAADRTIDASEFPSPRRSPHVPSFSRRTIQTAIRAIFRTKMRSALTMLGIVIGIASVIAMMEIGQGSSAAIKKMIASMGANNLLIQPGTASSGGVTFGSGSALTLTPQDAEAIARQVPSVAKVAPMVRARTQAVYGNRNWVPFYIYGSTPTYLEVREWEQMGEGEMFTDRDVRNGSKVCVIGQTLVRELFQGESPIGKEIRIQNVSFRVIGVLSRKGASAMGFDQDDIVLAPWTTIKNRVSAATLANVNQSNPAQVDTTQKVNTLSQLYPGQTPLYSTPSALQMADTPQPVRFVNIDQIIAKAASAAEVPIAVSQITELLRDRHRIDPGQPDDFNIRDMTEMSQALTGTSALMGRLLLSVALISLVVGGVGIMNIMLVSVTERTREIGLRMAVGARTRHILAQFLIEAVVLCLLGGVTGIALGRGGSALLTLMWGWPTMISMAAIIAAVLVAFTVGVVFGFYPAWKASRLDPITALRYE